MNYAPAQHWDKRFSKWNQTGTDLDWQGRWIAPFVSAFPAISGKPVLDLGCGSGNDVRRLAEAGHSIIGLDYSHVALIQGQAKSVGDSSFVLANMASPLPFADGAVSAVMSNVAAHMFSDAVTRILFKEIERITCSRGRFLFHLNALEDRPLRAKRWPG